MTLRDTDLAEPLKPQLGINRCYVFFIYKWIGAKFYFDWILPTNWSSKNPLFRVLWLYYWRKPMRILPNNRLIFAYVYISIHTIFLSISIFTLTFGLSDVIVNIYPIIVNLYIGYRCKILINYRRVLLNYT